MQAAACLLVRMGATTAPPTTAKASARAIIRFFMCELPRLLAWDLGASLSFAREKPPRDAAASSRYVDEPYSPARRATVITGMTVLPPRALTVTRPPRNDS